MDPSGVSEHNSLLIDVDLSMKERTCSLINHIGISGFEKQTTFKVHWIWPTYLILISLLLTSKMPNFVLRRSIAVQVIEAAAPTLSRSLVRNSNSMNFEETSQIRPSSEPLCGLKMAWIH